MKIAFLGTGIMGAPMAANLARAGHDVTVWNRTAEKAKAVAGAHVAATPAAAAAHAEVVWLCLADTAAVETTLFGADGVFSVVRAGLVVADSSTISPRASGDFARRFREHGAAFVDVPVTGSKVAAESGELVFIAGGDADVLAKIEPLLQAMGKKTVHLGPNGMGLGAKLALNLNIVMIYQGLAEGLVLAEKSGLAAGAMLDLMSATMVRSGLLEYKRAAVEKHDFSPNFPLRLMHKDIELMLEHAREMRVKLPALETVEEVYSVAVEEGLGERDYAACLSLLEKWAGLPDGDVTLAAD